MMIHKLNVNLLKYVLIYFAWFEADRKVIPNSRLAIDYTRCCITCPEPTNRQQGASLPHQTDVPPTGLKRGCAFSPQIFQKTFWMW